MRPRHLNRILGRKTGLIKRAFASPSRPFHLLAGGALIALVASIGWMSLQQPAGSSNSSARGASFVAEVEEITDSLLHFLDGGTFGLEDKNTAKAGVLRSSHSRRPVRGEAGLP